MAQLQMRRARSGQGKGFVNVTVQSDLISSRGHNASQVRELLQSNADIEESGRNVVFGQYNPEAKGYPGGAAIIKG